MGEIDGEHRTSVIDSGGDQGVGAEAGSRTPGLGADQDPAGARPFSGHDRARRFGGPDAPPLADRHPGARDLGQDRVGVGVRLEEPTDDDVVPSGGGERGPPVGRPAVPGQREHDSQQGSDPVRDVCHESVYPPPPRACPASRRARPFRRRLRPTGQSP